MSFSLPSFPLTCEVYSGPWLTKVSRLTSVCNLALGRRGQVFPISTNSGQENRTGPAYLLLPPLTDVRDLNCSMSDNDLVEVPQGSGRWYAVLLVDDVGKGFSNEHRYCEIEKISQQVNAGEYPGLFWPTPIP